jgi:hypothetical protein
MARIMLDKVRRTKGRLFKKKRRPEIRGGAGERSRAAAGRVSCNKTAMRRTLKTVGIAAHQNRAR